MTNLFHYMSAGLIGPLLAIGLWAAETDAVPPVILAAVVHKSATTNNISALSLRKMLTGDLRTWPDSGPIVLIEQPDGSVTQQRALKVVLGSTTAGYRRLLMALQFQGKELPAIKILNSDEMAIKFVWNVPGAIAIVAAAAAAQETTHVKILKIDGRLPGESGYLLQ